MYEYKFCKVCEVARCEHCGRFYVPDKEEMSCSYCGPLLTKKDK